MQPHRSRPILQWLAVLALLAFFASSSALHAQPAPSGTNSDSHLVTSAQLDQQVRHASATRQKQIEDLTNFVSTPEAQKVMKDAKIDPSQVKTAIPSLSDAELADLSARADRAQKDFSAGILGTTTLLLIILIILVIILVSIWH